MEAELYILYGTNQWESPGSQLPDVSWQDIIDLCEAKRHEIRHRSDKPHAGWICPAILAAGATSRRLSDVVGMSDWIGLDIDHSNWTLSELLVYFAPFDCIAYSTTSSTSADKRWRVIVRLSHEVGTDEFSGVWRACNAMVDGQVDKQTKNLNRQHYLPACWIGGNNEFHVQSGVPLDVEALLAVCPPEPAVSYTTFFKNNTITTKPAPYGTPIFTDGMIERHMRLPAGGGRFFRLLCAGATRFKAQGWTLAAWDLAQAALAISDTDSGGVKRISALREAERAISYIDGKVAVETPLEKLNSRLRFKYRQHAG